MPPGRLLNLNQIVAGVRPAVAVAPAKSIKIAMPVAAPAVVAPAVIAPAVLAPAAPAEVVARPAVMPAMRINPAMLRAQPAIIAQLEGRTVRPRLNDLRPGLFPIKADAGFVRSQSPHPISPSATPDDRCLFEDPHNPQQRYWLPRYRVRNEGGRYEIKVAQAQDGLWAVSVAMETYPAAEIGDAARSAQMLPVARGAVISYRAAGTAIEQRLPVGELIDDPRGGCVAMLRLSLAERDALLRAFMSSESQARLLISRGYTVAVPLPASPAPDAPKRQLMMIKGQMLLSRAPQASASAAALSRASAASLRVTPAAMVKPAMGKPEMSKPAMMARGAAMPGMRMHIKRRGFDGEPIIVQPEPEPLPQPEPQPEPAPEPRYDVSNQSQDWAIPLFFEPVLHPYLYPSGAQPGPAAPRWVVHSLRYPAGGGRSHAYFQDMSDPARIYYLPDAFKLARRSEAPHAPSLAFRIDQGADADDAKVDLTCEVRPVTDGERLLAARRELASKVPASADNPQREFDLRLLRASSTLQLALMRDGAIRFETVPAAIDWDNGFTVNERFEFDDFQEVFAVLMSLSNSNLLQGSVVVSTGINENVMVPVKLNFADMEGELFQSIETPDPQTGAVAVRLLNATESKLRIARLPTWITRGEGLVEGRIEGLDLSQPVEIAPEQGVDFVVQPAAALSGSAPADAIFNTASVRSIPDGEAIMKYTLDETIDQQTVRPVRLMTTPEVLLNAGHAAGEIASIIVEFRGNKRAVLDAANLAVDVDVPVPLMDILLRRDSEGFYEYRQTVMYKSGQSLPSTPWCRTDEPAVLIAGA
ncbi:hypothetical protein [Lysobacter sp. ESA13C]|uniref:hypothetical protein n=1 Tax=Lysobacter sp. ESA13C TaxID=2862676 RepID=UPI001CBAE6C7|nr:hypothetical protein [Lysobacter sp. ESA13C]